MTTVLIAVDETDSSVHAVEAAHRLFGDSADYLVLNVGGGTYVPITIFPGEMGLISPIAWAPPVPPEPSAGDVDADGGVSEAHTDADAAETIAKLTGEEGGLPSAVALGVVGDPASAIIDVALEHSADVIVVGTHERGWLTRLLSPSVADEVRRDSPIPVLLVPHPDDHPRDH
jgi:nucleotide-binding universal stress UspA family protein